jgi:hypothetical protein
MKTVLPLAALLVLSPVVLSQGLTLSACLNVDQWVQQ